MQINAFLNSSDLLCNFYNFKDEGIFRVSSVVSLTWMQVKVKADVT